MKNEEQPTTTAPQGDKRIITTTIETNKDLTVQIQGLKCHICEKEALNAKDEIDLYEESELVFVDNKLVCNLPNAYHKLRVEITLRVVGGY